MILDGHSFGGLHVRRYAATYDDQVVGMTLLDPSHEKFSKELIDLDRPWATKDNNKLDLMLEKVPEWKVLQATYRSQTLADEGSISHIPTVIVTSSKLGESDWWIGHSLQGKALWRDLHASLIQKNPNSVHIVSNLAGHNIPLDAPDLVIDAINQTIGLILGLQTKITR